MALINIFLACFSRRFHLTPGDEKIEVEREVFMKTLILTTLMLSSLNLDAEVLNNQNGEEVSTVVQQIEALTGKKSMNYVSYAKSIVKYAHQYQIDTGALTSLIMTESSFNPHAVSKTGDLGLGQINPRTWVPEFKRVFNEKLDPKKLLTSSDYSIQKTAQILGHIKNNKDPFWIGKYHSKTPSLKMAYFNRIQKNRQASLGLRGQKVAFNE
jgi:hypothetical protein